MNQLAVSLIALAALLISLSTHEYFHALAGLLMGDETAKRMGRLTLNPLAHIDPVGTVLVPLIGLVSGLPLIGWAKPVPFNPYNLRDQKWGPAVVALAGPAANFGGAFIYLILLKTAVDVLGLPLLNLLVVFLTLLVVVNVVLGVFNFIPVPPLDGSRLLGALLTAPKYRRALFILETRGPLLLFLIILLEFISPVPLLSTFFNAVLKTAFGLFGLTRVLAVF